MIYAWKHLSHFIYDVGQITENVNSDKVLASLTNL
jgi:hypothetical protein